MSTIKRIIKKLLDLNHRFREKMSNPYFESYQNKLENEFFNSKIRIKGSNLQVDRNLEITDFDGIIIGKNVKIGRKCYIDSVGGLVIGDDSQIGDCCHLYTRDCSLEQYSNSIYIGRNVIIGNHVTIMPGVKIPDNAIIQSGSTISKSVNLDGFINKDISGLIENHDLGNDMFFIVSTGRSGSKTIAKFLSQHPEINCLHEPRKSLIRLSTQYEYGELNFDEVVEELRYLYTKTSNFSKGIYGESDQKISNLILPLSKVFPKAKFIWLVRDGKKVVKSTTIRGWYNPQKEIIIDDNGIRNVKGWIEYRLQGDKTKSLDGIEWQKMSSFEKNCWYWSYWNNRIKKDFEIINDQNKLVLKLEDLENESTQIQSFLNVSVIKPLKPLLSNKSNPKHLKSNEFKWTKELDKEFNLYCGDIYKYFYK